MAGLKLFSAVAAEKYVLLHANPAIFLYVCYMAQYGLFLLTNREPLYDAYTTYLPGLKEQPLTVVVWNTKHNVENP